jgi:nucleoid DNA-binding protein
VCNPTTGAETKIPAKTVVKMRGAKAVKEIIVPERKQEIRRCYF